MKAAERVSSLTVDSWPVFDEIADWFSTPLGQYVLMTEEALLDQLLPEIFGYHLAQLSVQDRRLYQSSTIQNKFSISMEKTANSGVVAAPVSIPLASDSVDVVLLHHLLDYTQSHQNVLREISRITMPMGHVVIVGFNPVSVWGLWRTLARLRGRAPWNGALLRPGRLMDYLNLLDFKIDRAQYAIYGLPVARWSDNVNDYSQGVSRRLNLPVGSVYVIVAQKQVAKKKTFRPVWPSHPAFARLTAVQSVRRNILSSIKSSEKSF